MRSYYDSIYLSPHLDDAAFSCGGQIHAQAASDKSALIVTIMAGDVPPGPLSDLAHEVHDRWELVTETVARRRNEDIVACRILGADYLHWEIPDCIYRTHAITGEPIYSTWEDVFGEMHSAEAELIDKLAKQIRNLPNCRRIFSPLTIGNHVDHQITRAAAERCLGRKLFYYEDYPYVRETGALEKVFAADETDWQKELIPLNETDLQVKVESIAAFASQLSTFFDDRSDMVQQVVEFTRKVAGERIWHRSLD